MTAVRIHRARSGFTLIEILVALGIFVVGMISIVGLLVAGTGAHRDALVETDVTFLVDSILAEIEGAPDFVYGGPLQNRQNVRSRHYPDFLYHVTFEQLGAIGLEVLVQVEVFWKSRGQERSRTYRTILLKRIPS